MYLLRSGRTQTTSIHYERVKKSEYDDHFPITIDFDMAHSVTRWPKQQLLRIFLIAHCSRFAYVNEMDEQKEYTCSVHQWGCHFGLLSLQ